MILKYSQFFQHFTSDTLLKQSENSFAQKFCLDHKHKIINFLIKSRISSLWRGGF